MKTLNTLFAITLMVMVTACGGSDQLAENELPPSDVKDEIERMPDFYQNPPEDDDEYLYATGTGVSSRQRVALQKAEANAKQEFAQKFGETIDALQKSFTEEITSGNSANYSDSFSNVSKILTSQELKGVSTVERVFIPTNEETLFRSYVLMRMPIGQARTALENALSQEEELYIKFKESEAFKELEKELKKAKGDN